MQSTSHDDALIVEPLIAAAPVTAAEETANGEGLKHGQHLKRARSYLTTGQWQEAINELTGALKGQNTPDAELLLLLGRSRAFASLSKHLRSIPAKQSERSAIYALDPLDLARLARNDAEKALRLDPSSVEAHLCKGEACHLLEAYEDAEAALLEGLGLQPADADLQESLAGLRAAMAGEEAPAVAAGAGPSTPKRARRRLERHDEFDCTLCMKLLHQPITTPCGHSFCRLCFQRAFDHSNRCPLCRRVLHVTEELPVSVTLNNIIARAFPEEHAERRQEAAGASAGSAAGPPPVPLFIMCCVLPGETIALNIFEPRYRLLVRRVMQTSRRFGMATVHGRDHALSDVACECEIRECQPQPDGRFFLEISGRRRFRITGSYEQDGYRVAKPEYFSDDAPASGSEEATQLQTQAEEVLALGNNCLERLSPGHSSALRERSGVPAASSPEAVSFWAANLVASITTPAEKLQLLRTTSTAERLAYVRSPLSALSGHAGGTSSCRTM